IQDICTRIWRGFDTQRIQRQILRDIGIIVSEVVVAKAGFGVVILTGETEGSICRAVGGPGGGAPEGGATVPGEGALFVDELGRGGDEVGDDGEKSGVDFVLWSVRRSYSFGLAERLKSVVIPGEGNRIR